MVLKEVLFEPIAPASVRTAELGCALPPAFDAWFARCVAREPAARFSDATHAGAALAGALVGGVAVGAVPLPYAATITPATPGYPLADMGQAAMPATAPLVPTGPGSAVAPVMGGTGVAASYTVGGAQPVPAATSAPRGQPTLAVVIAVFALVGVMVVGAAAAGAWWVAKRAGATSRRSRPRRWPRPMWCPRARASTTRCAPVPGTVSPPSTEVDRHRVLPTPRALPRPKRRDLHRTPRRSARPPRAPLRRRNTPRRDLVRPRRSLLRARRNLPPRCPRGRSTIWRRQRRLQTGGPLAIRWSRRSRQASRPSTKSGYSTRSVTTSATAPARSSARGPSARSAGASLEPRRVGHGSSFEGEREPYWMLFRLIISSTFGWSTSSTRRLRRISSGDWCSTVPACGSVSP